MRLLSVLVVFLLVGCGSPVQLKTEYKKISPQEAQNMMVDNVMILDVRTQEEFDEGHIRNAVLLPDYEVKEKVESIITDKNQTILVYCRTSRRSEIASKELIEMGYTNVFDFGGIVEWTGEIVGSWSYSSYYNYFGGNLPPDIVTPIDFTVSRKINEQMPEFTFHIQGSNEKRYGITYDGDKYYLMYDENQIEEITITDSEGTVIQKISDLYTANSASEEDMYGFSFDDWNFDGFTDISLWTFTGGSMLNKPTQYWIWNNNVGEFVEDKELADFSSCSTVYIDIESNLVASYTRVDGSENITVYYKYGNGKFVCVKNRHVKVEAVSDEEDKYFEHIVVEELINGKMTVVEDYYEDVRY